jgi:hypothetical protein
MGFKTGLGTLLLESILSAPAGRPRLPDRVRALRRRRCRLQAVGRANRLEDLGLGAFVFPFFWDNWAAY